MRIASSGEASPCGVAAEMKLLGAAATRSGNRAWDAAVSKLQLNKSIPAASAAAASSGDLTWTWTRQRFPLSCCKSKTEYFLSGRSMGKLCRVDASASSQELNKNPRYGVKHPQMVPM